VAKSAQVQWAWAPVQSEQPMTRQGMERGRAALRAFAWPCAWESVATTVFGDTEYVYQIYSL
jgi:hypothetical protein